MDRLEYDVEIKGVVGLVGLSDELVKLYKRPLVDFGQLIKRYGVGIKVKTALVADVA